MHLEYVRINRIARRESNNDNKMMNKDFKVDESSTLQMRVFIMIQCLSIPVAVLSFVSVSKLACVFECGWHLLTQSKLIYV